MLSHNPDNDQLSDRIKEYRDQSWQMEIIIAGGTVITLASITDSFRDYFFHSYPIADFSYYAILVLFAAYLVTRVLLIGFVANLILRAVWLAYLGINFSFPKGVNFENIGGGNQSKKIVKEQPNILQRLISLEKLCHLSYSLAILLALLVASAFISLIVISYILETLGAGAWIEEPVFAYSVSFLIIFVQIGLLNRFLFSSKLRLSKTSQTISKTLGLLTLSFLFRREILVLKTNTNRWFMMLAVTAILVLATTISANQIGKYWPHGTIDLTFRDQREYYDIPYSPKMSISDYDDLITEGRVAFRACIQSEIIKENYVKLFVVYWSIFDKYIAKRLVQNEYPLEVQKDLNRKEFYDLSESADSIFSKSLNESFIIEIGDTQKTDLQWRRYSHPVSLEEGYITYINIEDLETTEHILDISVRYFDSSDSIRVDRWERIPFGKN